MGHGFPDHRLESVDQECPWWFRKILLTACQEGFTLV